ncbi:apoptosis inhibitor 5-like [Saccostrea echinata]|uniref:apoptosis inhibitor 5-like n=1 Tax=Saccostrea echinata TaxID=191078 RepID=UPI002A83896D|nr:apoptosis inhibitor 5-like [Saccostrea echinata]
MVTIEILYKDFGVLADAKDKAGQHEKEYLSILSATKGGPGEKRLASQFITRFFKYFPNHAGTAINAMFDLCEDDDPMTRKQAIKDLPTLCKTAPDQVSKIASALTQLMGTDDATENSLIQSSFISLFKFDSKGALEGIFGQILGDDETVREKAIKFLGAKIRTLPEDTFDSHSEELLINMCKKVLQDVTKDEFIAIMEILKCQKSMTTVQGRQQLVDIVTEQAELDQPFEATDPDCVDRLTQCIKHAVPLFSKNVHSKAFVGYICDHVLPHLEELASPEEGVNGKLEMLKLLAEISEFAGDLENLEQRLQNLYDCLISYMPLPPAEESEDETHSGEPKLEFSAVECLMYTFHQLCRKLPTFLSGEENAERLKDFKIRLQYFARGVQVYIKHLRMALQGKTGTELKEEENKIKVAALKITSNINTMIKDLFHSPPSFKSIITLSWKPLVKPVEKSATSTPTLAGQKRTPITFESNGAGGKKHHKEERSLYHPPSGKFSEKAGTFTPPQGGRGRFNRRGNFRGRGRGQRW